MARQISISTNPEDFVGHIVGNGQCVAFVREAAGLGHTSTWRRGPAARGSDAERGTAIATFDAQGRYANRTDGTSHAAIMVKDDLHGLLVFDQWKGQAVHQRTIRFQGGQIARWVNDGDRYFLIETDEANVTA